MTLQLPAVSDPVEHHADWIEYCALTEPDKYVSWTDHARDLRLAVSEDEADEYIGASTAPFEVLITDIVSELEERRKACGGNYPFVVSDEGLAFRDLQLPYVFQLLLTLLGKDAGPPGTYGARLFEDLCAEALGAFLRTDTDGGAKVVFGFPRRVLPSGFAAAVDELCIHMGEGIRHADVPTSKNKKDAALDIVAWRGFPDKKTSKLVVFGQCSTGKDWVDKRDSLRPSTWCKLWLSESPHAHGCPLGAFMLPRRIPPDQWRETGIRSGIIFDRCRITWLTPRVPLTLGTSLSEWIDFILSDLRRENAA